MRRIHLETSSVLIRQLPLRLVNEPAGWTLGPHAASTPVPENSLVAVSGASVTLGKPRDFPSFGWDNEYGHATLDVPDFQVSRFLITNREFLAFVHAGGYSDASLWSPEGWRWASFREARHPTFWVCAAGCKNGCGSKLADESHCTVPAGASTDPAAPFRYRTVFRVIDMPWDWPVDVNYLEAKAYCAWRSREAGSTSYRLPTEAEYARLRGPVAPADTLSLASDLYYNNAGGTRANLNMVLHSATPVNLYPPTTPVGVYDVQGNVWQWAEDHFNGLPGFQTHFLYDDFSAPCFDSRHSMIVGGSFISTGDEASRYARFAFRRHFFQHCGFRLVASEHAPPVRLLVFPDESVPAALSDVPGATPAHLVPSTNSQLLQENEELLATTLAAEYLPQATWASRLASAVVAVAATAAGAPGSVEGLNLLLLGASTGRVAFELTALPAVGRVVATDFWGKGIGAAIGLQNAAGTWTAGGVTVHRPSSARPDVAIFKQLTWIPQELGSFDVVILDRYLSRAGNPAAWTARMREVVQTGGLVVLADAAWPAARVADEWTRDGFTLLGQWVMPSDDNGTGIPVSVWQWA
jgi:5-histidylcysteine sulfoxide synthase